MLKEFSDFLFKSNALALAVGVIIGAAVGKVVTSIVSDLLMPLIGLVQPGGSWREIKIALNHKPDGSVGNALMVGSFLGTLVDLIIIGFVVFLVTKALLKPPEAQPAPPSKTCKECLETIALEARKCKHCGSPA